MPSKLEDRYNQERKDRFGVDRLEVQETRRTIDLTEQPTDTSNRWWNDYLDKIESKYGIEKLELVGVETKTSLRSLADAVIDHDRQEARVNQSRLKAVATTYKNTPIKIYYEIGR